MSRAPGSYAGLTVRQDRNRPLTAETVANMDALAEHVADGGSVRGWSKANGFSQSRADQLWQHIKRGLGAQAA